MHAADRPFQTDRRREQTGPLCRPQLPQLFILGMQTAVLHQPRPVLSVRQPSETPRLPLLTERSPTRPPPFGGLAAKPLDNMRTRNRSRCHRGCRRTQFRNCITGRSRKLIKPSPVAPAWTSLPRSELVARPDPNESRRLPPRRQRFASLHDKTRGNFRQPCFKLILRCEVPEVAYIKPFCYDHANAWARFGTLGRV